MQSNDLFRRDSRVLLSQTHPYRVSLGKLPQSNFLYHFFICNPSGIPGKLTIFANGENWKADEQIVKFNDLITEHRYNFDTTDLLGYCQIDFLPDINENIYLRLPVSPVIVQSIEELPAFLFGLDEKIQAIIDEVTPGDDNLFFPRKRSQNAPSASSVTAIDAKIIEGLVHARYFKGFLSLEEGGRQLDYVIFHKMFNTDGDKGFVKFKKKVYRKILRGIYRLLSRNRSRKLYLAKLYTNYVNTGILAENAQ